MTREPEASGLRGVLLELLRGRSAHLDFDAALEGLPPELAGVRPEGLPHSVWELVEHLRIALEDLVEYSRGPEHDPPPWPDGFWPDSEAPPDRRAWEESVGAYRGHLEAMRRMVADPERDPLEPFPWSDEGHTLAREAALAADHAAYHLGQVVQVRRLLGAWPPESDD